MSYDIELRDPNTTLKCTETKEDYHPMVKVPEFTEGGTYPIGGTDVADLNVTYNYAKHFDYRQLNGMKAEDSVPILQEAVDRLGTEQTNDYWAGTPGNAGYACNILLEWAKLHPSAIWDVT